MGGLLIRAMAEINTLCKKADVQHQPRVSITFANQRDRELFKAEVKREMEASGLSPMKEPWDFSEGTICGVRIRIL